MHAGFGVAQQFPGDGRGFGHAGDDFYAGVVEVGAQGGPQVAGVVVGLEDGAEQLVAHVGQPLFDAGGDGRGGVPGVLQEIFQIPAQVFAVLGGEGEGENGRGFLGQAVSFQAQAGAVLVFLDGFLGQA